jgi:hypothetical protein
VQARGCVEAPASGKRRLGIVISQHTDEAGALILQQDPGAGTEW